MPCDMFAMSTPPPLRALFPESNVTGGAGVSRFFGIFPNAGAEREGYELAPNT